MHQSMPAASSLPGLPRGDLLALSVPGISKVALPGGRAFANPGRPSNFCTHVVSYPNITTQRILLEKQADLLICQEREKIVEGCKGMFSILCMHFFIAYQAGIL